MGLTSATSFKTSAECSSVLLIAKVVLITIIIITIIIIIIITSRDCDKGDK